MPSKIRQANGGFELAEAPSHLMRRCEQYYADLYAREAGKSELTRSQMTVLAALDLNDGVSQTALVETTGIDRSTLAEMVRRMLERGLITRNRTETDLRANAVAITPAGRRALRAALAAVNRAERALLEPLPAAERVRFVKYLAAIAAASQDTNASGAPAFKRKLRRDRGRKGAQT
ncbi:MAG: winged helix-turn-helix transcriptional regulator [Alphaproteobacteria bacterium]|nr:winged helix-turn-helix transcriptional regulator [Alphaproteobacteria bacterium]MBV9063036.1 winged helix-turn-helix transcriptional regulator [Alphaproteobacteria bacterium]